MDCTEVLDDALVVFDGNELLVRTAKAERRWRWTGNGFLTKEIGDGVESFTRSDAAGDHAADWILPVCETENPPAILEDVCAELSDDEGFTSQHVCFSAHMIYPDACLEVRFTVWVYPGAPGFRTALHIRAADGFSWDNELSHTEVSQKANVLEKLSRGRRKIDSIPACTDSTVRRYIGYHSDTQNRSCDHQHLLLDVTEEHPMLHAQTIDWANACCVEGEKFCVALLKESHKCVNQRGHDTGLFVVTPGEGIASYGWGILPGEISTDWQPAWAGWSIVYGQTERTRQQAFKQFDRLRYPLQPADIGIQANTWGSSVGWLEHREAASEANVLKELESCADLGIEILQIDDGWQGNGYDQWIPDPTRYPKGWKNVRQRAKEKGVRLGLWMAAQPVTLEDLSRSLEEGDFVSYKLDFARLTNREQIDTLMDKVRSFILQAGHTVRVNWDLTEVIARYGYFFAREYGCIYLENRKPEVPVSALYRPATVLRDLWEVAQYCNLLKFQGSVQNIDMVDTLLSDACIYSHAYCTAITLMSSPLFFCEIQRYSDQAREEIRPVLRAYRQVRDDIYRGIVYPIGSCPDGKSWTGFECEVEQGRGYLTLFREPGSSQSRGSFTLPHLCGTQLKLYNLLDATEEIVSVDEDGTFNVEITDAGDFRFLRYETI